MMTEDLGGEMGRLHERGDRSTALYLQEEPSTQ